MDIIKPMNFYTFNFTTNLHNYPFTTLTENIFSNVIDTDIISDNSTATIPNHLPQFVIIPNMFGNTTINLIFMKEAGVTLIK